MTATTSAPLATTRTSRSTLAAAGAVSTVLALVLTTLFAHDWREVVFSGTLLVVTAVIVYGWLAPRAVRRDQEGATALGLAVPAALLVVPAFWSGLPVVLGTAGLVLGAAGRRAGTGSGKAIAALCLAALAVLVYLSVYVMEGIAGNTGFLLD